MSKKILIGLLIVGVILVASFIIFTKVIPSQPIIQTGLQETDFFCQIRPSVYFNDFDYTLDKENNDYIITITEYKPEGIKNYDGIKPFNYSLFLMVYAEDYPNLNKGTYLKLSALEILDNTTYSCAKVHLSLGDLETGEYNVYIKFSGVTDNYKLQVNSDWVNLSTIKTTYGQIKEPSSVERHLYTLQYQPDSTIAGNYAKEKIVEYGGEIVESFVDPDGWFTVKFRFYNDFDILYNLIKNDVAIKYPFKKVKGEPRWPMVVIVSSQHQIAMTWSDARTFY